MNRSLLKTTARIVLVAFLFELLGPTATLLALTGGPTQPEFSSFEPVTTTNMVNPLTGQFTYNLPVVNIPGPNGGGYALSLSYHSGVSPEEEASWVGYGWTLNPGSITRAKRGLPDEYNGETVRYWNATPKNETVTASVGASYEIVSATGDQTNPPTTGNPDYSASVGLRYNTHKGFGFVAGVRSHMKGMATLGFSVSDEGGGFSAEVNAMKLLNGIERATNPPANTKEYAASTWHKWASKGLDLYQKLYQHGGYQYLQYSAAGYQHAPRVHPYSGSSTNVKISVLGPLGLIPAGVTAEVDGHYSWQENAPFVDKRTYGYMYSGLAGNNDIMDYYVEKDASFDKRDNFLGVPFSNADYFNVSGEGMGGGFRLYNKKPGHFHQNAVNNTTTAFSFGGANIHFGQNLGLGISLSLGKSRYSSEPWRDESGDEFSGEKYWKFATPDEGDEPYFFRMNNDMGGYAVYTANDNAYAADASFDDKPEINPWHVNYLNTNFTDVSASVDVRSGRSSHIAYNIVGEMKNAKRSGVYRPDLLLLEDVDFSSYYYLQNLPNDAVGEISITNPSGAKYTYGLPVIALEEKQYQYGLDKLSHSNPSSNGTVDCYVPMPENASTLVGQESMTPYVSEYLLTSIANPNYVDRTHDGFSNDDFGGWVRFNYKPTTSHLLNSPSGFYQWRMPYKGLTYTPNKLSDRKDDVGGMASGKKSIFYLSSVETKSHVALFYTNGSNSHPKKSATSIRGSWFSREWLKFLGSTHTREDGYPAWENDREAANGNKTKGGVNSEAWKVNGTGAGQAKNPMRRLEKIELWSKDKDGNLKEKLQTTYFEYTYELCQGLPNAYNGAGKLTLKRVYFEYNGVTTARISPYVFGYEYRAESNTSNNDDYAGLTSDIKSKYSDIITFANNLTASD
ncbi:MAG: hypothetical protein AB7H80_09395, partial [Candidatus Kapaibacterium sp.]